MVTLKWLRSKGCPWDWRTWIHAADSTREWLIENNCPTWDLEDYSCDDGPISNAGALCKALIAALPGRYWEGKEKVMITLGEVYSKNLQVVREEAGLEDEIAEAVLARVRSERKEKMVTSLLDLVKVLGEKLGEDFSSRVRSLLEARVSEAEAAEDEEDGMSSEVRETIRKFIDQKLS